MTLASRLTPGAAAAFTTFTVLVLELPYHLIVGFGSCLLFVLLLIFLLILLGILLMRYLGYRATTGL